MNDDYLLKVQVISINISLQLALKEWRMLSIYLQQHTVPQQEDSLPEKALKAALIQLIIKINKKYQDHYPKLKQLYKISLTPAERYALEDVLVNVGTRSFELSLCFHDIRTQLQKHTLSQLPT